MSADVEQRAADCAPPDRSGWQAPLPARVPQPTAWPMVLAFGTTLLAWGIVTSWIIAGVGLVLFACGVGGWIAEMRHEQEP